MVAGRSSSIEDKVAFDIHLPTFGSHISYDKIETIAREAERLGFKGFWISDHLINPAPHVFSVFPSAMKGSSEGYAIFEAWILASAVAVACKKMRVGTYVLCNSFRLPSLLAKMASTLDVISGGRVDLGLGSGWLKLEFEMYGFPWESYQARYEKLREAVQLMTKLFQGETVSFDGKHYSLKDAVLSPTPTQQPRPPIYLGGWSDRIIKLAAEEADGWIPNNLPLNEAEKKILLLKKYAGKLGRRLPDIIYGIDNVIISEDEEEIIKLKKSRLGRVEIKKEEPWIAGKPEECADKLSRYIRLGVKRFVIDFADPNSQTLKIFSEEVITALS